MEVLGLLSADSFGILILMGMWVLLGLAGALAELTYDRHSAVIEHEFLPDPERRIL